MKDSISATVLSLFQVDALAIIMISLVGFVSINVSLFSLKYLKGDRAQKLFFNRLFLLIPSVFIMVTADHLLLFFAAWAISNYLLTRLMIHKSEWKAAKESGNLALKNFILGMFFLAASFIGLYAQTGSASIHTIIQQSISGTSLLLVLSLLFLAAMTQSAIWPFHKWLTSSLNSPTPVSALMHAGLVNGGGFLLARFALLFTKAPMSLQFIFFTGLITAIVGTLWKLMQNDVKRMLASSTMGQMGFMMVQCGLGLFPAAIAHLCWHGLFKAYLFLSSGSAAQEKRLDLNYPPSIGTFILSLVCGAAGAYGFALISHKSFAVLDTTLFLTGIAFLGAAQLAIPLLKPSPLKKLPIALISAVFAGAAYGSSVYGIEKLLEPLHIWNPQPLGLLHIIGFLILTGSWLFVLFGKRKENTQNIPAWMKKGYVSMLNASQPHPTTITAHHNHYQY
ncbi:MAG: proton-conducting membrane transporter [Bacteroidota bacterium]|nr:proton-conducting membrane transporter [Bacteroidota bacterium]